MKKIEIKDVPSESKSAAKIAKELENEPKKMIQVAKILKGGRRV